MAALASVLAPATLWLIQETVKLVAAHLSQQGKFNGLTQPEAEAMITRIAAGLTTNIESPEILESDIMPEAEKSAPSSADLDAVALEEDIKAGTTAQGEPQRTGPDAPPKENQPD
jgi:hypothetical protein